MELSNLIEAILFYQAEPIQIARLTQLLKRTEGDVRDALNVLEERLNTTGVRLMRSSDEVTLGTSPDASALIEAMTKEELSKDLSKSALETLAIVLYKGPITRAEIDYIRGVNSTFILRNLLIRGLVEKVENPKDQRSFLYKSTFALLEYLGITKTEELPEYHNTLATLATFINTKTEEEKEIAKENTLEGDKESEENEQLDSAPLSTEEIERDIEADILEEDEVGDNYADKSFEEHQHPDKTGEGTP